MFDQFLNYFKLLAVERGLVLEMSRKFKEVSRKILEMSRQFLEISRNFLEISRNFLEISRKFLEISGDWRRSRGTAAKALARGRTPGADKGRPWHRKRFRLGFTIKSV